MKFAKAMGAGSLKKEDLTQQVIVQESEANTKMGDPNAQQEEVVKNVAAKLKENGFLGEGAGNSDPVMLAEDALGAMGAVLDDSAVYSGGYSFDDQTNVSTLDNKNIVLQDDALNEENNMKDPQGFASSTNAIYEMDEDPADFQKNESFKMQANDKSNLTAVVSELATQNLAASASQEIKELATYMGEDEAPTCGS